MLLFGLMAISIGWADIGAALRQGNCQAAMSSDQTLKPHYVLGLAKCQILFGNLPAAMKLLESIDGEFEEYARLLAAEVDLLQRKSFTATSRLQQPMTAPGLENRRRFFLGKSLLAQAQPIPARDALRGLISESMAVPGYFAGPDENDPAEIRWLLSLGALMRNRKDLAIPLLWKIWTDNPNTDFSEKAASKLMTLGHRIPDSSSEIGRSRIAKRAETFQKRNMHREALDMLKLLPLDTSDSGISKMANACFQAKDYECAISLFGKIKSIEAGDQFRYALATTRLGDYETGAKHYRKLIQTFPNDIKRKDLASFKLAYLKYDKGRLKEGINGFQKHLKAFPSSRNRHKSLWFIGWSKLKLGLTKEARTHFKELTKTYPTSRHGPGAQYWIAKSIETEFGLLKAIPHYKELLNRFPVSGYAYFAAQKTGITFPKKAIAAPVKPPETMNQAIYFRGLKLAEAGFDRWARFSLRSLTLEAQTSESGRLSLAHGLILAGDYVGAKRLILNHCPPPGTKATNPIAQLCLPRPHGELVDNLTRTQKIPRLLPYAIMTAESALKPWVTSPAGARGLMQLMPEVAEAKHQDLFNTAFDPDLLYNAGYNTQLGVTELNHLSADLSDIEISDKLPLIIAAYNGGEKAVRRWVAEYDGTQTADEFSENIGYSETRNYVRRVLGFYMAYRWAYGD